MNMQAFWFIIILVSAFFIFFVLPILMFWSESSDDTWKQKLYYTAKWETLQLIVTGIILFVSYLILSKANVPVQSMTCDLKKTMVALGSEEVSLGCTVSKDTIKMTVSFPVYLMCLISFVGWFLFILFAGVGLAALPLDLIMDFRYRPKSLDANTRESR